MAPAASEPDQALRNVLETFETRLATPIVSGELAAWASAVSTAWSDLSAQVRQTLDRHRDQYQEISAEDPELLSLVEKLKAEDAAILQDIRTLADEVTRIAQGAEHVEPNEGKIGAGVEKLTQRGVAFLNRVRKQEVAVRTWFFEAFNRDRGVAD